MDDAQFIKIIDNIKEFSNLHNIIMKFLESVWHNMEHGKDVDVEVSFEDNLEQEADLHF